MAGGVAIGVRVSAGEEKNKPSTFGSCRGFQTAHNPSAKKTLTRDEIRRLSPSERLTLIGDLWDSLDGALSPLPDPQRIEIDRRISSLDRDLGEAVTLDELKAELAARAP